jgi:GH18 family chitinase
MRARAAADLRCLLPRRFGRALSGVEHSGRAPDPSVLCVLHHRGRRCTVGAEAPKNFAALAELKKAHPHLRTLISIGGWGAGGFSDAALTEASRKRLVDSCMALFFDRHAGSFDGVDIDWEFRSVAGRRSWRIARRIAPT